MWRYILKRLITTIQYWSNFIKHGNPSGVALPEWEPFTTNDPKCIELNASIEMVKIEI